MQSAKPRVAAAIVLISICFGMTDTQAVTHEVTVFDIGFQPSALVIAPGDTVRWTNAAGGMNHDVTADDFSWNSVTRASFNFEMTFDDPGNNPYHCTVHSRPANQGGVLMNGTVFVQGATTADLKVNLVKFTGGSTKPGEDFEVETRIRNAGDEQASGWDMDFYLSDDNVIDTGDTLLGSAAGVDLAASDTDTRMTSLTTPANVVPGDYFIGVIVNFADADPANNIAAAAEARFFGPFLINAGVNDAWFNSLTAGQGFFFVVFPDIPLFFMAWFTYDTERPPEDVMAILGEPGHRWVTGQGGFAGDTAMVDAFVTAGGVFDSPEPVPDPADKVGTFTIVFTDCENATLTYDLPDLGLMNSIELTRIALDNVPLCQELNLMMQE